MDRAWKIARLRDAGRYGFANARWAHDALPRQETLLAGRAMILAEIEGPGVVTHLHTTMHSLPNAVSGEVYLSAPTRAALCARGVVLEVYYDGSDKPSVLVPLADFFADGCAGRAGLFSTRWIEKAPDCYNIHAPLPFAKHLRIVLRNETPFNLINSSYVEFERLTEWDGQLGYFHATWRRHGFQIHRQCEETIFQASGRGQLVGRSWSLATDEPLFAAFNFVTDGNNEVRIDGEAEPRVNYLGSDDSFGFRNWTQEFRGQWSGINFLQPRDPAMLSIYRFHEENPIPFNQSLDWRLSWRHEFPANPWLDKLDARVAAGGGWVDCAATHYWYQETPGHDHYELIDLDSRMKPVLHPNPPMAEE